MNVSDTVCVMVILKRRQDRLQIKT